MRKPALAAVAAGVLVIAIAGTAMVAVAAQGAAGTLGPASGVPAALVRPIDQAAAAFCDLPAELLAAVLKVESNFDNTAVSPAGAFTMAQFLPATWAAWAVNGNPSEDHTADPGDVTDVIFTAARYLCALGAGNPDTQRLAVAAYNAGPAAVARYHGIPPFPETVAYVQRVFAQAAAYAADQATAIPTGSLVAKVIAFAVSKIGTPYEWGGDGRDGFYDCSGFTMRAYQQAGVQLPRTAAAQYQASPHVDRSDLQVGDLLFWAYDVANPATIHHVAIYLGKDQSGQDRMIDAPHTGATIQIRAISWAGYAGSSRPLAGLAVSS